jgi:hypothetical protein
MERRRKLEYLVLVVALIPGVSPLPSFAGSDTPHFPSRAIFEPIDSRDDKADGQSLYLSMSLFMSSPSLRPATALAIPAVKNDMLDETEGESLFLSLSPSLSLSSSSNLAAINREDDGTPLEKPDNGNSATSRESLFDDNELSREDKPAEPGWKKLVTGWRGFSQLEIADNYSSPEHFSKAKLRTELSRTGQFNEHIKWKVSGRFDYDAAYDLSSYYPSAVRQDQRYDFFVRENYLDISTGDFDFRLGRQHVIWGEMVGLFFADVVSAKDQREFILPAFDIMRIPQWAMRAEYSKNDTHVEVLWIPVPTIDEIGKHGSDFYPGPLRGTASFLGEDRSGRNIGNSNYGVRLSQLINGWDISGFYYHSLDAASTFYRVSGPAEPLVFQPRHDEIDQVGATVTKDFGSIVLKGELVYTDGRKFNVSRPTAINGLFRQNTLDYAVGLDFNLPADTRLNLQFFQRVFFAHDRDSFSDQVENGASILLSGKLWRKLEAQALLIHSLNRSDWMFRPRLSWQFEKNWRWALGGDVFGGEPTGLFGRFENNDRVYTELRFSF